MELSQWQAQLEMNPWRPCQVKAKSSLNHQLHIPWIALPYEDWAKQTTSTLDLSSRLKKCKKTRLTDRSTRAKWASLSREMPAKPSMSSQSEACLISVIVPSCSSMQRMHTKPSDITSLSGTISSQDG